MKKAILTSGVALVLLAAAAVLVYRHNPPGNTVKTLKVARCVGYCNLPLFLASGAADPRIHVELQYIPNPGDHGRALIGPHGPTASVTPFTNAIVARGTGLPVKIIAGSGMNGLAIISRPEVKSIEDLRGKKVGTFRADTLEAMAYAALKEHGIQDDVSFIYFADALEPLTALRNGELDAVTHVEPFVTQLVNKEKMTLLVRGDTVWGTDHPDCVLLSTEAAIKAHRNELKQLILLMTESQLRIETSLDDVAREVAEPFYNMAADDLVLAVRSQFPAIDIRGKADFVTKQGASLKRLGYIQQAPAENELFDLSLLAEVVAENPDLFTKVTHRYPK